jgi:hypothetical protein
MKVRVGCFVVLASLVWAPARAEDPATVGPWGDPARVAIHGATAFAADQIRAALFRDFRALLASHPLAPREELAPIWERRLIQGYRKAGYAEATVHVTLDEPAGQVLVQVQEGPRYTTSNLRIEGGPPLDLEALHARLTTPHPPESAVQAEFFQKAGQREVQWRDKDGQPVALEKPVWKAGRPAPLDDASYRDLEKQVRSALGDQGYPLAQFQVTVLPSPQNQSAELLVQVGDVGPAAEASEIVITGAEKNSRAAILAYLDLKPGEIITQRRRLELVHRLWESGRFLEHRVRLDPPQADQPAVLHLDLKEYALAPALDAPLSREEAALLKTRTWLAQFAHGGQADLVLAAENEQNAMELIFSPRNGLLLTITQHDQGRPPSRLVLLVSEEETGVYLPDQQYRISGKFAGAQLRGTMGLALTGNAEKPFSVNFGMGVRTLDEGEHAAPLEAALSAPPVFCLAMLHEDQAQAVWQGDRLTLASQKNRLTIDARDGRILEYAIPDPQNPEAPAPARFVSGAFAQRRAELLQTVREFPNLFDRSRPVTSLITALLHEDLLQHVVRWAAPPAEGQPEPNLAWARLVRKLAERDVLRPLDDAVLHYAAGKQEKFAIPPDPLQPEAPQGWLGALAVSLGLPLAEQAFPRESWPWTLCRETALTLSGAPNFLEAELNQIYRSAETGPLACGCVAWLLRRAGMNGADAFAARGMADLSPEAFVRDCRPLVNDNALTGTCLRRLAEALRTLEEAEVQQISHNWPQADAAILQAAARELRADREKPLDAVLPQALAAAWQAGLRMRMEAALESFLPNDTFRIGRKPAP